MGTHGTAHQIAIDWICWGVSVAPLLWEASWLGRVEDDKKLLSRSVEPALIGCSLALLLGQDGA